MITSMIVALFISCDKEEDNDKPKDPDTAEVVSVDRFGYAAGNLMKRSADASLPTENDPIDFDVTPFITKGLGPEGEFVESCERIPRPQQSGRGESIL